MKRQWKAVGLMIGGIIFGSAPAMAAPDLNGTWKLTFYSEPNHTTGATQCLVFTKTGTVAGESNSGTWTSPSFSGWKGQWIQEGDHVRFFGFSGTVATSAHSALMASSTSMSGEFDHFRSPGTVSSSGAWSATKVNSCSQSTSTQTNRTGDPAN